MTSDAIAIAALLAFILFCACAAYVAMQACDVTIRELLRRGADLLGDILR